MGLILGLVGLCLEGHFVENRPLWERIDELNLALSGAALSSDTLEELFQEAVETAFSGDFLQQMDDLYVRCFMNDSFDDLTRYTERALPAITVLAMGESVNIGVNPLEFLLRSEPGTEAYEFFDLASDGFYVDGASRQPGTAELPVWMERGGSSFQAFVVPGKAREWLGIWQSQVHLFDGYFLELARETITGLGGDPSSPSTGPEPLGFELDSYHAVYSNPYVRHVRNALDTYLEGGIRGINRSEALTESLEALRACLDHRFAVLSINPSPMGGQTMLLISQTRPDLLFHAWVYRLGDGAYELRDFHLEDSYSPSEIKALVARYREFLLDTEHRI
jgi:hypothetical protein